MNKNSTQEAPYKQDITIRELWSATKKLAYIACAIAVPTLAWTQGRNYGLHQGVEMGKQGSIATLAEPGVAVRTLEDELCFTRSAQLLAYTPDDVFYSSSSKAPDKDELGHRIAELLESISSDEK